MSLAEKYGYHSGKPAGEVVHETPPATKAEAAARSDCAQKATAELAESASASNFIYGLKSASYQSAVKSDAFLKAAARWRACMLPLGIPDLPEHFVDGIMPTESQRKRYGMHTGVVLDAPAQSFVPTTVAEVREAVFDAQCREKSGLSATLYELEVDNQLHFIKKDREKLGRAYEASQEDATTIDKIIKKYAG